MKYTTLRLSLQTFDIALFTGKGFVSNSIRLVERLFGKRGKYSHVGIIIRNRNRVMLFESTTLNGKKGVQLNYFSQRLKEYNGSVFIRQMACNRSVRRRTKAAEFVALTMGLPYEKHLIELAGSAVDTVLDAQGDYIDTDYFCSELVTGLLKYVGLANTDTDADEFAPDDYATGGRIERVLANAQLAQEIPITA